MANGGSKQPGFAAPPAVVKAPAVAFEPDVVKNQPLSWALSRMDFRGDWGWSLIKPEEMPPLHKELRGLEGETLHSLLKNGRIKDIPAGHMCRKAKERLEHRGLEEHDTLWELRLEGKRRVWGFVHESVYHFLWWDPRETACGQVPRRKRRRRTAP
jgi:hypothetical protein